MNLGVGLTTIRHETGFFLTLSSNHNTSAKPGIVFNYAFSVRSHQLFAVCRCPTSFSSRPKLFIAPECPALAARSYQLFAACRSPVAAAITPELNIALGLSAATSATTSLSQVISISYLVFFFLKIFMVTPFALALQVYKSLKTLATGDYF